MIQQDSFKMQETKQTRIIFSNALNDNGILFGGLAMKWMDEVAYITALRHSKMKVVTISADKIKFKKPIRQGAVIEIVGKVIRVGLVKKTIQVIVLIEDILSGSKEIAIEANFDFACVNENFIPIGIAPVKPFTEIES